MPGRAGIVRRIVIGFLLRLAAATALSLFVWWLAVTPFDRLPFPRSVVTIAVIKVLNFPVALAGELLYPIRGMQLLFDRYDTWCDFCPPDEMFRLQMRIAIPTYVLLLYVPALIQWIARRDPRRFVIGLCVYALFTTAFFLITGISRSNLRIAAALLVVTSIFYFAMPFVASFRDRTRHNQ